MHSQPRLISPECIADFQIIPPTTAWDGWDWAMASRILRTVSFQSNAWGFGAFENVFIFLVTFLSLAQGPHTVSSWKLDTEEHTTLALGVQSWVNVLHSGGFRLPKHPLMQKSWGWEETSREKYSRNGITEMPKGETNKSAIVAEEPPEITHEFTISVWPRSCRWPVVTRSPFCQQSVTHREKFPSAFNPVMQSSLQYDTLRTPFFLPRAHTGTYYLWLLCLHPLKPSEGQWIAFWLVFLTPSLSYKLKLLSPSFQQKETELPGDAPAPGWRTPFIHGFSVSSSYPSFCICWNPKQTLTKITVDICLCTFCSFWKQYYLFSKIKCPRRNSFLILLHGRAIIP